MSGSHRLAPLLTPRSIALVGASTRCGSPGSNALRLLRSGGFFGEVFPVNPRYEVIDELPCFPTLHDLPERPDLAVLVVRDERLEDALAGAISAGARSVAIFGGTNLLEDCTPRLPQRLRAMAIEADIPVCGGNCMGFYNLDHKLSVSYTVPPIPTRHGNIALISHSGSSWCSLTTNDGRLAFNLAISSGQEFTVSVAEYLDFAIDQPSTRVIGLIIETVREPERFLASLEKANARDVPILALKVGRTPKSAQLALSHSGAIVGNDAAYEAIFDRFNVGRVRTLDELAAGMCLFGQPRKIDSGGLIVSLDSGCERELLLDLAEDEGTALAELEVTTTSRLTELLDPGLPATNPLDAWGSGRDYKRVFVETFCAMIEDPSAALGFVAHSLRDGAEISAVWTEVCLETLRRQEKPVAVITNFSWTQHSDTGRKLSEAGVPVIEGMRNGLVAARLAFRYRDKREQACVKPPPPIAKNVRLRWRDRLALGQSFSALETFALLRDYGIETVDAKLASNRHEVLKAIRTIPGAVVLKTADPRILHKSDVGGVHLNLKNDADVLQAYKNVTDRLGPDVIISPMMKSGVEMSLGLVQDKQFGSLLVIAAGGIYIELMRDRCLALPPIDGEYALRLLSRLDVAKLLGGYRGQKPMALDRLAQQATRLSLLAIDLGDLIAELDLNPVIVTEDCAVVADSLLVTRHVN